MPDSLVASRSRGLSRPVQQLSRDLRPPIPYTTPVDVTPTDPLPAGHVGSEGWVSTFDAVDFCTTWGRHFDSLKELSPTLLAVA